MSKLLCLLCLLSISTFNSMCFSQDTITKNIKNKQIEIPSDKSVIYIVRPSILGFAVKMGIDCNGNYIGATYGKNYIYTIQGDGLHNIKSSAENKSDLSISVQPNQEYYIKQAPRVGILYARNKLKVLSSEKGVKKLNKCNLSTDFIGEKVSSVIEKYMLDSILYLNDSFINIEEYIDYLKTTLSKTPSFKKIIEVKQQYTNGNLKVIGLKAIHELGPNVEQEYKIGTWTHYYRNGNISKQIDYDLRKRINGDFIKFNEEGVLIEKNKYKFGELITE